MKNILIATVLTLLIISCDKNTKYGVYEYEINNQSTASLKIEYFYSFQNDSFTLSSNADTIFMSNWSEMNGLEMLPVYLDSDSAHIIFNEEKIIKFYESSNNLINGKSILNEYTYNEYSLPSSEKNEENKRYTFTITEQDYMLADSL